MYLKTVGGIWKQRSRRGAGLIALFLPCAMLQAADRGSTAAVAPVPGQAIYKRHCAVCHGDKGSGAQWTQYSLNPAPRDFTAPRSRAELSRERMLTSVTYGRPGTAMMPFSSRLDAKQIASVVDYIRSSFMGEAQESPAAPANAGKGSGTGSGMASGKASGGDGSQTAAPAVLVPADMSLPFPRGLVGDARRGGKFYMKNCFTCHGREGNGRGPRAAFNNPPPRNFLGAQARATLNRPTLFEAIKKGRPGSVMPAWGTVLDDQAIADVAEFVLSSFISPSTGSETASGKKKAPIR